jgi:hypothetical protein
VRLTEQKTAELNSKYMQDECKLQCLDSCGLITDLDLSYCNNETKDPAEGFVTTDQFKVLNLSVMRTNSVNHHTCPLLAVT